MAKPKTYDQMTESEKFDVYSRLMQDQDRRTFLINQAVELSGNPDLAETMGNFMSNAVSAGQSPDGDAARLAIMLITIPVLEAAIGTLTMKDHPDWSNIGDMEIIRDGFVYLTRIETEEE